LSFSVMVLMLVMVGLLFAVVNFSVAAQTNARRPALGSPWGDGQQCILGISMLSKCLCL
jgi:hypothetical protein